MPKRKTQTPPDPGQADPAQSQASEPPQPAQDRSTLSPARLSQAGAPPPLPTELQNKLSPRDLALLALLLQGLTWGEAQKKARVRTRAQTKAPPDRIREAAEYQVKAMSLRAGLTVDWITAQLVELYGRAAALSDVTLLNRSGVAVTGRHWDGATARACLELLGSNLGMFSAEAQGNRIPVDEVAALLRAVGSRGRAPLPGESMRVPDLTTPTQQVPVSTGDATQQPEQAQP